jgi:hypothetical protein
MIYRCQKFYGLLHLKNSRKFYDDLILTLSFEKLEKWENRLMWV